MPCHNSKNAGAPPIDWSYAGYWNFLVIEFVKGWFTEELAINEAVVVVYATLYSGLSFKIAMGNILMLVAALAFIQEQLDKALHILEESVAEI